MKEEHIATTLTKGIALQKEIGFPCEVYSAFSLSSIGWKTAKTIEEFVEICERMLELSPTSEVMIQTVNKTSPKRR